MNHEELAFAAEMYLWNCEPFLAVKAYYRAKRNCANFVSRKQYHLRAELIVRQLELPNFKTKFSDLELESEIDMNNYKSWGACYG